MSKTGSVRQMWRVSKGGFWSVTSRVLRAQNGFFPLFRIINGKIKTIPKTFLIFWEAHQVALEYTTKHGILLSVFSMCYSKLAGTIHQILNQYMKISFKMTNAKSVSE